MTMAEGLAQSINTISVQVAQRAGIRNVVATAHRLGISSQLMREMSLALGTNEVNLIELVSAYAPFANGGTGAWPHRIPQIPGSDGEAGFPPTGSGPGQAVSPETAVPMNAMTIAV